MILRRHHALLLSVIGVCAVMVLGALLVLAGPDHSSPHLGSSPGRTGSGLSPFISPGGNVAAACSDVDTCTTGAIANVDAGDTLLVVVTEFTTSAGAPSLVEEVTSSGNADLTELGVTPCVAGSGHGVTAIYGLADVTAQSSVNFTVNYPAVRYYTIHALDVEGAAASPFETIGAGVCSSAAGSTGTATATTTVENDLVILGVEIRASTAVSATGGDTLVNEAATTGADLDSGGLLDEPDPSTGSISLSANFTSASWAAIAIGLKPATSSLVSGVVSPASASIDAGQTIELGTTPATGGTPPITYQWYAATAASTCSSGTPVNGATGRNDTTAGLAEGTYYYCVWATDSSTPTAQVVYSNVATITVNPALAVSVAPEAPAIDSGQTVELTAHPSGGTGADTFAWYSGATCSGPVLGTGPTYTTTTLTADTTYCVVATDSAMDPQTAAATANVTVSSAPLTVTITPSAPTIASGHTISLTAIPSGGTGADSYAWYAGGACSGPVLATSKVYSTPALNATTTYCVAVTDSSASPATASANATVTVTPLASHPSTSPPSYAYPIVGGLAAVLLALLLVALLARRRRTVNFLEAGLPATTEWAMTLKGETVRATDPRITFRVRKGTYDYTVNRVAGYSASHSSGTVTVGNEPAEVKITFNI